MKLHIVHRTRYEYSAPVIESFNETRLQPVTAEGQVCHSFLLKVLPSTRLSHYLDFHLNCVHFFQVPEPHTSLLVESVSTVSTSAAAPLAEDAATAPMSRLPECAAMERCYDFLQASAYVDISPEVWRLAVDATTARGGEKADAADVWRTALRIMRFIYEGWTYTPLATHVNTHMSEVIEQRRGVCQDFAHVMLGMCRTLKIPARYVSGYLYNGPAGTLSGSEASHAWCEVFLPGIGWRALDPTNNQPADERYVKVAVGRDYADIIPVQGTFRGGPAKDMTVEVRVTDAS